MLRFGKSNLKNIMFASYTLIYINGWYICQIKNNINSSNSIKLSDIR